MESAWLRACKAEASHGRNIQLKTNMATAFIHTSIVKVINTAMEIIAHTATGSALEELRSHLVKLTQYTPTDTIAVRDKIAGAITAAGKYVV